MSGVSNMISGQRKSGNGSNIFIKIDENPHEENKENPE